MSKVCPACGYEQEDNAKFCNKCGHKFEEVAETPKTEPEIKKETPVEPKPEKKEGNKKSGLIIALILLLVAAVIAGVLLLGGKKTVTFDSDGGTPVATVKLKKGEKVAEPAVPAKEGYDFTGWYLNDKEYDFNLPVNDSITLKAHWDTSKYVTFMVDGKEVAKEHVVDGHVKFPEAPTLEGYAFVGWQDASNMAEIAEDYVFTSDMTLVANYKVFVPVTSIKYEKSAYTMEKDSTLKPKLIVQPANWAEQLSYSTGNSAVAEVAPDGTITAKQPGKAVITVKTESGKTATTEITVVVSCKSVKFAKSEITIKKNEKVKLEFTIDPADTTDSISFSTSDKKIATVDANGNVTGVAYGTATITLKCGNQKATIKVHVANPATSVTINASNIELAVGETYDISKYVEIKPSGSTSKVNYTSSNTMVFTVDSKGVITAVGKGAATITVSTDNDKQDSCGVTVSEYKLNVGYEKHGVSAYYLYYRPDNRPYYKLTDLSISVNGKTSTTSIDLSKLKMVAPNNILYYNSSDNELYATNRGTVSNGFIRTQTLTIYFTYSYDGHTVRSENMNIVVEPMLEIKFYGKGTYDAGKGEYHLPAEAGTHEFTIQANQKLASWDHSSNLTITGTEAPTPTSGKPAYFNVGCRYSKTSSSSPANITLKTPAGQKIEIKYIR